VSFKILVRGEEVEWSQIDHPHGRPCDLCLWIGGPLFGGDEVLVEGNLPRGKGNLWVHFFYESEDKKGWMKLVRGKNEVCKEFLDG
jgi:hypothetical protein